MINKSIPFHVKHIDVMDVKQEYRDSLLGLDGVRYSLMNIPGGEQGDAATILIDGRIVLCVGYWLLLPGVVEVWILPSVYMEANSLSIVKDLREYLEVTSLKFNWHRAQTVTQNNFQHQKWMSVLGFVEEGIMKRFFQKQDYIMSAMYFER